MFSSYKKFSLFILIAFLAFLFLSRIYVEKIASYRQINPNKLALIDISATIDNHLDFVRFYDRKSPLGLKIMRTIYGPYAPLLAASNIPLSIPKEIEFSLPQIKINNKEYVVRESPTLRYRLWEKHPPDLVLMGSSMLFQNFNRGLFHEIFPEKHLIDFCIGDNIPDLTLLSIEKLLDLKLIFQPGATVIYGINTYELMSGYHKESWEQATNILKDVGDDSVGNKLNHWIRHLLKTEEIKSLFCDFTQPTQAKLVYLKQISLQMSRDPDKLKNYLYRIAPTYDFQNKYPLDGNRYLKLVRIIQVVKAFKYRFVLILLPSSSWDRAWHNEIVDGLNEVLVNLSKAMEIEYYNFWDHKTIGIDDTDFVFRGKHHLKLNPQHLNYDGTIKFTKKLMETVIIQ